MYVERAGRQVVINAPAKLNLYLEVLGKRPDGFHELETLMTPIRLFDTLAFAPLERGEIDFSCDWGALARSRCVGDCAAQKGASEGDSPANPLEWPADQNNLVVKALHLLRKAGESRRQIQGRPSEPSWGARVSLVKRIPVAAGLAGGSSDAAAALIAGNEGWKLGLSTDELSGLAAQLGSDVPFFIGAGPAICRGRGERIERVQLASAGWFVVVRPSTGLSTAEVFRACRPNPADAANAGERSANRLVEALRSGGWEAAGPQLYNALEPAAESLNAEIAGLRQAFDRLDVLGRRMSGSGTSYFAICRNATHARRVAAQLRSRSLGHVFAVSGCR